MAMWKDAGKNIKLIAAEFSDTEGKFVWPVALKLKGRWLEVVEPAFDEFESPLEQLLTGRKSRRGRLYYLDSDVDVLVYLTEEEGRRGVRVYMCRLADELCRRIEEVARKAWTQEGEPRHVMKTLEALSLSSVTNQF